MRLTSLILTFILAGIPYGVSWAVPPAPWVGGPSGERSVIGGRSIRKPGVPVKDLVGKGTVGTLNVIVIRAQFDADDDEIEDPLDGDDFFDTDKNKAFFDSVLSSVSQYYSDVSEGQLTLNFTVSNSVYSLNQPMGYYGDDNQGGAEALIIDSVRAADDDIDFKQFEAVIVIHAGVGEESLRLGDTATYIWSQRVSFPAISVDGVDVGGGSVVPEKQQDSPNTAIVGVIAHEFGHELGLPDLYDVDGTSMGIGRWGLMGTGSWCYGGVKPCEFMAWSKLFLGWASTTLISSDQTGYALLPGSEGNQMVKVNARGYPDSEEYFLLEYRRQTPGSWDEFLPGQGLLIWHIDEKVGRFGGLPGSSCLEDRWRCNEVNTDEGRKYVDLEEADGVFDLDNNINSGDDGDPFLAGNSFNVSETPNSRNNAGGDTGVSVTNISAPDANITFDLSLGFHVKSVSLVNSTTVDVEYNRPASASPSTSNYTLTDINGTGQVPLSSAVLRGDNVTVRLGFVSSLSSDNIYRLTVQGETDNSSASLQFNPTIIDNPLGTNVVGVLNGHEVWSAAGNPYYVTGNLTIEDHLSLTINEGAVVKIKKVAAPNQIAIIVSGLLKVQGSVSNPVLITSAGGSAPGDWGAIQFRSASDDRSVISHAVLEYGVEGLRLSSASPTISDSTFRYFSEKGIITFGDSSPSITGSTFTDNLKGVQVQDSGAPVIRNNLFSGNTQNGVIFFGSGSPTVEGNTFTNNNSGVQVQGTGAPMIKDNIFSGSAESGALFFDTTAATVKGNTFSGNGTGISCSESSTPLIVGNNITGNSWGVSCLDNARPTIIGNSFDANTQIGLAVSGLVGTLNPVVVGNNFINHDTQPGNWAIYAFDSDSAPANVNALHNYFNNNRINTGMSSSSGVVDIGVEGSGHRLSNPVDWAFAPSAISFRDAGYSAATSFIDPGSSLYIQLEGTDGDSSVNSILVHVKGSSTGTTGIYIHLNETGAGTGIYRTAQSPETLASVGTSTDQSVYRLGAAEGETLTVSMAADSSVAASAALFQCVAGDVDGIGGVDISDIIFLIRTSIALEAQPQTSQESCRKDLNNSGSVDILDAIAAARILLGL